MTNIAARYRLTEPQAAAAIAVAGLRPSGVVLGRPEPVGDPVAALAGTDYVDAAGALLPALAAALQILSHPDRVMAAMASVVGSNEWRRLQVPANDNGYVVRARDEAGLDLMFGSTSTAVATVLDDFFDLTTFPSPSAETEVALGAAGWWGLLAAADIRRTDLLRADLERSKARPTVVTEAGIAGALADGAAATDTRWLVTALTPLSPVPASGVDGAAALTDLVTAGLAGGDGALTETGADVADGLLQTAVFGAVTQAMVMDEEKVRVGEMTLFRGPTRLLVGLWADLGSDPRVTLVEPAPETALAMLRDIAELGARLDEQAPEPADEPAPPEAPPDAAPAPEEDHFPPPPTTGTFEPEDPGRFPPPPTP